MTDMNKPAPDPKEGGSYIRHKDGSLQLVSQTKQESGRVRRAPAAPAAPAVPASAQPAPDKE